MEYPTSLNTLLESTELKYRWVNIGRGIRSINNELFNSIEQCKTTYPWPVGYQAWFALIVWNPSQDQQHTIWFFKLPLDEQGLLIPQARDALIKELLVMLGIISTDKDNQSSAYTFDPDNEQKAAIHAKVSKMLAEPPSSWFLPVKEYLSNKKSSVAWSSLGLQGFADITERTSEKAINSLLTDAISWVDAPVFEAVCSFLQNKKISTLLASAICGRIHKALAKNQTLTSNNQERLPNSFYQNGVRALAQADITDDVINCIHALLSSPEGEVPSVLQHIELYCWATLKQETLVKLYLNNLASIPEGQSLFNQQVSDLMFVPDMRPLVLAQFRSPERSDNLGIAIGKLMGGAKN